MQYPPLLDEVPLGHTLPLLGIICSANAGAERKATAIRNAFMGLGVS